MKAQKKLITGTVLLMSAFLLGGCAFGTATTTSSHKAESTKVVKNDNHKSHKQSAASSEKENSSSSAVVSESRQALSSTTSNEAAGTNATQTSTVSQGSQATSQSKQAPAQEVSVLNRFLAASGISQENGDAYMVTKQSNGNYQVEVRHTGAKQDQNIANLKGLYQYNPQTNAVHKLDINTNEYK